MKYLSFLVLFFGLPLMALAQSTDVGSGFVPLTNIPILAQTGNSFSLDQFLNGLYRICIGIAAVLAVLQIMRAGIMYMGGDSVTEKKEAKNLIAMAIGGLILVLSPVVVFSIINPEILTLKINNIEELAPKEQGTTTPAILPSTEQGVCSVTYIEMRNADSCSALGSDWETASLSCCMNFSAGFCCGRKAQAPAPDTGSGFRYRIAVQDTDSRNPDFLYQSRSCVRYEEGTEATQIACVGALDAEKIQLQGKQYQVVKECVGQEATTHAYTNLPTCTP